MKKCNVHNLLTFYLTNLNSHNIVCTFASYILCLKITEKQKCVGILKKLFHKQPDGIPFPSGFLPNMNVVGF